jgi:hypothetical protein
MDDILKQAFESTKPDDTILTDAFNATKTEPLSPWWQKPIETIVETTGMLGGGALGSAAGPIGTIAGAGLGYSAARQASDRFFEMIGYKKPEPILETTKKAGKDILVGAALETGGQVAGPLISKGSGTLKASEQFMNKLIDKAIEKGIRPTVSGKSTSTLMKDYLNDARTAVKTIVNNKNDIILSDEMGNAIQGELPKNVKQFGEAIDQMKKQIFTKYDKMAISSTDMVELAPIAKELETVSQNKVLNDLSPNITNYAAKRAEAFTNRGGYTTSEAQDAIAHLNDSLQAFYKNPTYENASKASIDSMIANRLRKNLDNVIENSVGEGYQELKNTYGALKSIEKEVNHRAIVDARKNVKGLIDFSDIYTGPKLLEGLLTLNPMKVGKALATKTVAATYKYYNNPNTIVRNMFESVESLVSKTGQPRISEETGKNIGRIIGLQGIEMMP